MGSPLSRGVTTVGGDRVCVLHNWPKFNAAMRSLAQIVGSKQDSSGSIRMDCNHPRREEFLEAIRALAKEQKVVISEHSVLQERRAIHRETAEWYVLTPRIDHRRACDVPLGQHVMGWWYPHASETLLKFLEQRELRGLAHIWEGDSSTFETVPWFRVFATGPIGRGVDHPWVDIEKVKASPQMNPRFHQLMDPMHRRGLWAFHLRQVRSVDAVEDPLVRAVASLPGGMDAIVDTIPRYLRCYLPEADFAFDWIYDPRTDQCPQGGWKSRVLLSRECFDMLRAASLLSWNDVWPVLVVNSPAEWHEDLDARYPNFPPPSYTPEQFAALWAERQPLLDAWRTKKRHKRKHTVKQVQKTLRALRRELWKNMADMCEPAAAYAPVELALRVQLPESWKALLHLLPSHIPDPGGDGGGIYVWSAASLHEKHREHEEAIGHINDAPRSGRARVWFGNDINGDVYGFIVDSSTMPADCPVVQWDHETGRITKEWAGVPSFVHECIATLLDQMNSEMT